MNHEVQTTNQQPDRTSKQGTLIATYAQLVNAFGEPNGEPTIDGKVTNSWIITVDGLLCTIYDYKENLNNGKIALWHVGGKAKACVQLVTEALAERV